MDRAYSSFLQQIREGLGTTYDFAKALALESDRMAQNWGPLWHYRQRGFYHAQIARYLVHFDRSQLHICLHDDLTLDPVGMLRDIITLLDIDPNFAPDVSVRRNRSGVPVSRLIYRLVMRPNTLKSIAKPLLPAQLRRRLVADFRSEIERLQAMIQRDLSGWLE